MTPYALHFCGNEDFERAPDMDDVYLNEAVDRFPSNCKSPRILGHYWMIFRHKVHRDLLALVRVVDVWPGDSRPLVFYGWWRCPVTEEDLREMDVGTIGPDGDKIVSTEMALYGNRSWRDMQAVIALVEDRLAGRARESEAEAVERLERRVNLLERVFDGIFVMDDEGGPG